MKSMEWKVRPVAVHHVLEIDTEFLSPPIPMIGEWTSTDHLDASTPTRIYLGALRPE
jgi:hypothetical protein